MDIKRWRDTALLGFASVIGMVIFLLYSALSIGSGDGQDIPEVVYPSVVLSLLLAAYLPYILVVSFFIALREILFTPMQIIWRQLISILLGGWLVIVLLNIAVILLYLFYTDDIGITAEMNTILVNTLFSIAETNVAMLIFMMGIGMRRREVFPRWLVGLTFFMAFLDLMSVTLLANPSQVLTIISLMLMPIWIMIVSVVLLLRAQGESTHA